jgi:glycine/D-amino acid oxidase-like deaminating enzyme
MRSTADVVICGAGIAGAAAAYHLAVRHRIARVVIVDERDPLTLTSDKGTQAYRNWWPGPDDTMLRLVSRSIDLLEDSAAECGNTFRMSRRGYVFATADQAQAARLLETAKRVSEHGMGAVRVHPGPDPYRPAQAEGYADQPVGADLLTGEEVHRIYPYLAPDTVAALHIRRAGWVNAVALGAWFLKEAIAAGAVFVRGRVTRVNATGGQIRDVQLDSGDTISTDRFVIAAGPGLPDVAALLDLELPVFHELHAKMTLHDPLRVIRRDAPFLIWTDPTQIDWSDGDRRELEASERTARLVGMLPGGVHVRPVDLVHGDELYLIWTFETERKPFAWPPSFDPHYGEVVLRGCVRMVPGLSAYVGQQPAGYVDGGYYCKTPENRPLIGPLPVGGAFVLGALSGMGVMSSHASAELLAAHVTGDRLPSYAKWFLPSRYDDPDYRALVDKWGPLVGQL